MTALPPNTPIGSWHRASDGRLTGGGSSTSARWVDPDSASPSDWFSDPVRQLVSEIRHAGHVVVGPLRQRPFASLSWHDPVDVAETGQGCSWDPIDTDSLVKQLRHARRR